MVKAGSGASALLVEQANFGEMVIALAQTAFCLLLLARYFLIDGPAQGDSATRVIPTVIALLAGAAVSAWMASRARDGQLGSRALVLCSAHVLVNLLANACEGDGVRAARHAQVRLWRDPERPGHLTFEVADDGPGFPSELLATALRGGLTTKAEGTGVGLSLVARIVETSSGTIALENLPPGGARVVVRLRSPSEPRDPAE